MPLPSAALAAALLSYASAASGLPMPPHAQLPSIAVSAHRVLGHYADGRGAAWDGSTDPVTGAITLHAGFDPGDRSDRCLLAHELTHYLQVVNGLGYEPITRAEPLAYRVEAKCFAAYRMPLEARWAAAQAAEFAR